MKGIGVLLTLLTLMTGLLSAQQSVKYAGFCFKGNYSDIPATYHYTNALFQTKDASGRSILEKEVTDFFMANSNFNNFDLSFGNTKDSKLALAFTMTRESIDFEKLEGVTKTIYNLGFSLHILDFSEMKVVQSYPVKVSQIDLEKNSGAVNEAKITEQVHKLIKNSAFPIIKAKAQQIALKDNAALSMKVANVTFSEEAIKSFGKSPDYYQSYASLIANQVTESLAFDLNLSMLPYAKDNAGQKMSLAFSDATVQNFSIPPSSYDIDVTVTKFYKAPHTETKSERVDIYGAYTMVKIYDADLGDEYWNHEVKFGAAKQTVINQVIDDSANFNEVLLVAVSSTLVETIKSDKELMKDKKGKKGVIKRCTSF